MLKTYENVRLYAVSIVSHTTVCLDMLSGVPWKMIKFQKICKNKCYKLEYILALSKPRRVNSV